MEHHDEATNTTPSEIAAHQNTTRRGSPPRRPGVPAPRIELGDLRTLVALLASLYTTEPDDPEATTD